MRLSGIENRYLDPRKLPKLLKDPGTALVYSLYKDRCERSGRQPIIRDPKELLSFGREIGAFFFEGDPGTFTEETDFDFFALRREKPVIVPEISLEPFPVWRKSHDEIMKTPEGEGYCMLGGAKAAYDYAGDANATIQKSGKDLKVGRVVVPFDHMKEVVYAVDRFYDSRNPFNGSEEALYLWVPPKRGEQEAFEAWKKREGN